VRRSIVVPLWIHGCLVAGASVRRPSLVPFSGVRCCWMIEWMPRRGRYGLWFATVVHSGQDVVVMVVFLDSFFDFLPQLAPAAEAAAAAAAADTIAP
jgi:hypothetical protein